MVQIKNKTHMKKRGNSLSNQIGRKLAEEASRRAEAMLAESQRISHLGSWDWDLATDKIQFSDEMFRIIGMLPGQIEINREVFIKFLGPNIAEHILLEFQKGAPHQDSSVEHQIILSNGAVRIAQTRVKAYKDENGVPLRLLGSTQDATEQKKIEENLKESEWRNRIVSESTTDYIFVVEVDSAGTLKLRWASDNMFRMTGRTIEDVAVSDMWEKIIHPNDLVRFFAFIKQALSAAKAAEFECRTFHQDGHERWVRIFVRPQVDEAGKINTIVGAVKDITERKQARMALRESEERFRLSLKNSPVSVAAQDRDLRFLWAYNQRKVDPEFLIGKTDTDLFSPETAEQLIALKRKVLQTEREIQQELWVSSGGQQVFLDVCLTPMRDLNGQVIGVGIATVDLTESKQAEEALRKSEEKYRFLIENMKDVIWQTSIDLRFTYLSRADEFQGGYKPEEVLGKSIFDFMTPKSKVEVMKIFSERQKLFERGEKVGDAIYEVEYVRKNGKHVSTEVVSRPVYDAAGVLTHFQGVTRDISQRKQMENALRESEARNRALVEAIPDLMIIQDRAGVYLDFHAADLQLLIAPPEFLLGRTTQEVLPPSLVNSIQHKFDLAFQTGELQTHEYVLEVLKGHRHFETRMIAYDDDRLLSIVRDITVRKHTEEKLLVMEEFQRVLLDTTKLTSILLLDCAGNILAINEFGAQLIGRRPDELLGLSIFDVFSKVSAEAKALADTRKNRFYEALRTAAVVTFEDFRQGIWFENTLYPILDSTGNVVQIAVYARDVTEYKQNEERLRQSEQWYRALSDAAHDMIFVVDRDDCFVYANGYVLEQFEVQSNALVGQPRSNWFRKPDTEETHKDLELVFSKGAPVYVEAEFVFPRGKLYLSTWLVPLKDQNGVVENVLGVSHDISEQKRLENSLKETNQQLEARVEERTVELRESHDQLRKVTHQIVFAQEEERRRISRELHDEAGQTLIGLRFSLDNVYQELPANLDVLRRRMVKALALTDQTLTLLRSLAYDLRPPTLDIMGINLGIKELCREFSDQTKIMVEYSGFELEGLQDEVSISLYRFVQESLTNVAKHAQASKVRVIFEYRDEVIRLSVQDNGEGISLENGKLGLGMVGIKERFDILGGWLEIAPAMPKGALIQVCLPWKKL